MEGHALMDCLSFTESHLDHIWFVVRLPAVSGLQMPRIENDIKLDFKDVLLRPKRSTLKSRSEV